MPYPDDNGQSDQFDTGLQEPSYQPQESSQPEYQSPNFDTENVYQPLPNLNGGIDRLVQQRQGKINKLLDSSNKNPVWYDDEGNITKQAPDPYISGVFKPIDAPSYRVPNPNAQTVQQRMAQRLQDQYQAPMLPNGEVLSNMHIYQNAPRIWNDLVSYSAGNMSPQNILQSPYWDQFKGLDNDMLAVVKQEVFKAIQPFYKPYIQKQQVIQTMGEEAADPDTGQMFSQFLAPYQDKILMKPGDKASLNLVQGAKEKASVLFEDPMAQDSFKQISEGSAKAKQMYQDFQMGIEPSEPLNQAQVDDLRKKQGYMNAIMFAKDGKQLTTILNSYNAYKKNLDDKRAKLNDSIDNVFEDVPGSQDISKALSDAIKNGVYDGREHDLASDLKKMQKSEGPIQLKGIGTVNGTKMLFDEKAALNKINTMKDNGVDPSEIYITPERKVISGNDFLNYQKHDVALHFPDSSFKDNGQYVKLPIGFFKNEGDQQVYLGDPLRIPDPAHPENNVPITYTSGNDQYVLRSALNKVGVSKEDVKSGEFVLGRTLSKFVSDQATPYETRFITAQKFLDPEFAQEGQRFLADGEFYKETQFRNQMLQDRADKDMILTGDAKDPSWASEFGNHLTGQVTKAIGSFGFKIGAGYNDIYNLLKVGFYKQMGDQDGANREWKNAAAFASKQSEVENSIEGFGLKDGHLSLEGVAANPNATMPQHIAAIAGDLTGGLLSIAAEMEATGGLGAPKIAEGLTQIAGKVMGYNAQLTRLSAMAGNASQIATIRNKLSAINTVVGESLNFMAQNVMTGHVSPTELAEGGGYGLILGAARIPGRGFFGGRGTKRIVEGVGSEGEVAYNEAAALNKPPIYADRARMISATAGAAGIFGLDMIIKNFQGMTTQQQIDWWKNPDNAAGMVMQLALPYFGAHSFEVPKDPITKLPVPQDPQVHTEKLEQHYKQASTTDLVNRGELLAADISKHVEAGKEPPANLVQEAQLVQQNLFGPHQQESPLPLATAADLQEHKTLNETIKPTGEINQKVVKSILDSAVRHGVPEKELEGKTIGEVLELTKEAFFKNGPPSETIKPTGEIKPDTLYKAQKIAETFNSDKVKEIFAKAKEAKAQQEAVAKEDARKTLASPEEYPFKSEASIERNEGRQKQPHIIEKVQQELYGSDQMSPAEEAAHNDLVEAAKSILEEKLGEKGLSLDDLANEVKKLSPKDLADVRGKLSENIETIEGEMKDSGC